MSEEPTMPPVKPNAVLLDNLAKKFRDMADAAEGDSDGMCVFSTTTSEMRRWATNVDRLTAENERLRGQLSWRKCDEEMPTASESVLICHEPFELQDIGFFDPEIPTASGGWWHQWDDPSVVPTHWKPLTPPEAK